MKSFDFNEPENPTVSIIDSLYCSSSYGREYADPYLGHGIGPVAGYGVRKTETSITKCTFTISFNGSAVKSRA
jgi:hypothetical protein